MIENGNIMKFSKILVLIRWNDYGPEKIPQFLLVCFYIGIAKGFCDIEYITDTIFFTLFATISSIYGYLINDFSDIEIDLKHGKSNAFEKTPNRLRILIIFGILLLDTIIALRFIKRPGFFLIWIIWIFLSTFYSIPPFRFKERGAIGIVVPAVAQQTLAILIIFTVYNYFHYAEMAILLLFPTVKGLSLIARHQIKDIEKDMSTQTKTYAVATGLNNMLTIYSWFLRIEFIAIWLIVLIIYIKSNTFPNLFFMQNFNLSFLLIAVLGIFSLFGFKKYFKRIIPDPYSEEGFLTLIHITFPTFVLPFFLVMLLSLNFSNCLILMIFF